MRQLNTFFRIIFILFIFPLLSVGCANNKPKQDVYQLVADAYKAYVESRWLEASQLYGQITQLVPEDHYAWFKLGNTQVRQGRIESAIYTYSEALKRDPKHAKTHFNLAIAYMLIAMRSMKDASDNLRDSDTGKKVVDEKLKILQGLVDQPSETAPKFNYLPQVKGYSR